MADLQESVEPGEQVLLLALLPAESLCDSEGLGMRELRWKLCDILR